MSDQVLNSFVPTEKFEKYFRNGISIDFFELIREDSYSQIDDEFTIKDLELNAQQIEMINTKYNIQVNEEDIIVNIFEQIEKAGHNKGFASGGLKYRIQQQFFN